MRWLAPILIVALAAATAHAGDDDDLAWPSVSHGVLLGGGARYVGDQSLAGPSLGVERAWGRRRWQGLVDVQVGWMFGGQPDRMVAGPDLRIGAGGRWLARSFRVDSSAAIQLYIESGVAVEHAALPDGGLTWPTGWFGLGWQIRAMGDHRRLMIRWTVRMLFSPAQDGERITQVVCRGVCPSNRTTSPIDDGFVGGLGIAW